MQCSSNFTNAVCGCFFDVKMLFFNERAVRLAQTNVKALAFMRDFCTFVI